MIILFLFCLVIGFPFLWCFLCFLEILVQVLEARL